MASSIDITGVTGGHGYTFEEVERFKAYVIDKVIVALIHIIFAVTANIFC